MARLNFVKSFRGTSKTEDGTLKCGRGGETIAKGDSYYWWANRAPGSRFSVRQVRCPAHRPKPSEMTPGRAGQLLAIGESLDETLAMLEGEGESADEFQDAANEAASGLREIAEELTEGADNIVEGFGHDTYQSEEMREKGEALEGVADELEGLSLDDPPEQEQDADTEEDDDEYEAEVEQWRGESASMVRDALEQAEV